MRKNNYFDNVGDSLIGCSKKHLRLAGLNGWDNAKSKSAKKNLPRGRVYWRLESLKIKKMLKDASIVADTIRKQYEI